MTDRVQFNTRERALSSDLNDLQAMGLRRLSDILGDAVASRVILGSGAGFQTVPRSFSAGLAVSAASNVLNVGVGILGQLSTTWPSAVATLESAMRLGILRAGVSVAIPATANTHMILEGRVVDVTTVTQTRDIFDVPTQTFVPTLVSKQVERRVEFQIIQGSTTKFPAFSGDPWVPLFGFVTDGAGTVPVLPTSLTLDLRPDIGDTLMDLPVRGTPSAAAPDAEVSCWSLHGNPGDTTGRIGGNFRGRAGFGRAWLRSDDGIAPVASLTATDAADARNHLYLAPLIANGVTAWPVVTSSLFDGSTKGVLVRHGGVVEVGGADNSDSITWPGGSAYDNFASVSAHQAVFCGLVFNMPGGFTSAGLVPFTVSSGGQCMLRNADGSNNACEGIVSRTLAALAGTETLAIDLRGIVPNNARMAILAVRVGAGNAGTGRVTWYVNRAGDTDQRIAEGTKYIDAGIGLFANTDSSQIMIPVHESSLAGNRAAMQWELSLIPFDGINPEIYAEVDLVGWQT